MNHNISGMKFYVARQVAEVQIHLKTAAHEGQKAFGEALVNSAICWVQYIVYQLFNSQIMWNSQTANLHEGGSKAVIRVICKRMLQ